MSISAPPNSHRHDRSPALKWDWLHFQNGQLEKLRRRLRKGGETSCLYRIPHMNLKLISTNNADSITNTPCGEQSHKQEQSHYQETLPQRQSAREYENK